MPSHYLLLSQLPLTIIIACPITDHNMIDISNLQPTSVDRIIDRLSSDPQSSLASTGQSQFTPRDTVNGYFTHCSPQPIPDAYLSIYSESACALLDVNPTTLGEPGQLDVLSGSTSPSGATPFALNYSGHQFGMFCPQLGSGRSVTLGEFVSQDTKRIELLQKGTGPNCFSRGGDGYCTLSACLTEAVLSEFCHSIQMPSVRVLAVAGGAPSVWRKGIKVRRGMITKIAPTFIKFGMFELFYYRQKLDLVKQLADFLIDTHFQEAKKTHVILTEHLLPASMFRENQNSADGGELRADVDLKREEINLTLNKYGALLRLIVSKTAIMIAHWQAQGFVHGLMNTVTVLSIRIISMSWG